VTDPNYHPELRDRTAAFVRRWIRERRLMRMSDLAREFGIRRRQLYNFLVSGRTSGERATWISFRLVQLDEGFRQNVEYPGRHGRSGMGRPPADYGSGGDCAQSEQDQV
jgi:hypothetical protein